MRILSTALLAGIGSVALAGAVAAHTLTVQLPDGSTEHITYAGNAAPQVAFVPAAVAPAPDWFGPNSPFALMQQISAEMDREAATMMRQMHAIAVQPIVGPGQPIQVELNKLPPGTQSYNFVSTLSPRGACSQSTEIIARGAGEKPQVITRRSGNCGPGGVPFDKSSGGATKVAAPDEAPATLPAQPRPQTYQASAPGDRGYADLFRTASW